MSTAGNPIGPSIVNPLVYVGASVQLTTTAKCVRALLQQLVADGDEYLATPGMASEVTLQNDPSNGSAIIVCDSIQAGVASPPTSYAYTLQIGSSKTYPNGVDLSRIYAAAQTGTAQLNVELNDPK